jgi:hypothetical protein
MKFIYRNVSLFALLFLCIPFAAAQPSVDFGMGFGTAQVKSNGSGIYSLNSIYAMDSCTLASGNPNCLATPSLVGFFMGFSGGVMFTKHFGFGAQYSFQPAKLDYGPMKYRQHFYDFNGIFAPVTQDRFVVKLQGGIGGARTGFTFDQSSCIGTAICQNYSSSLGSSNHFQVHGAVGVDIFVTDSFFIRPQFDLRYVTNFTEQFGSHMVPQGMLWIGFAQRNR